MFAGGLRDMVEDPSLPSEVEARVGTTLCRKYRLDAVLGIGGMAAVYAATHRNQAELAIKILHSELGADPDVCTRFLREAYAANSVKHRGVVKIVDDDVAEDGAAFLVMERLRGTGVEDLRVRCGGRMGLDGAVYIVEQLLDVLSAAHEQGIVHRDVKPANLFVTSEGEVKVLDFGIARIREAVANGLAITGAATVIGTPAYMAPEQALPGMTEIDERTDVWAAGATLFTLLSGETVHEGATSAEIVVKAATEPSRSLASVLPRVPRTIVEVVDCALAFEKDRRWKSAHDMRTALLAAYRLHLGRAPSRRSMAALLAAPMSGAALRAGTSEVRSKWSTTPSEPPSFGSADTIPSRTSVPIAADLPPRRRRRSRGWARAIWVLPVAAAMGTLALIGRSTMSGPEAAGSNAAAASNGPPALEAVAAVDPRFDEPALRDVVTAPAPPSTGATDLVVSPRAVGSPWRRRLVVDAGASRRGAE